MLLYLMILKESTPRIQASKHHLTVQGSWLFHNSGNQVIVVDN